MTVNSKIGFRFGKIWLQFGINIEKQNNQIYILHFTQDDILLFDMKTWYEVHLMESKSSSQNARDNWQSWQCDDKLIMFILPLCSCCITSSLTAKLICWARQGGYWLLICILFCQKKNCCKTEPLWLNIW